MSDTSSEVRQSIDVGEEEDSDFVGREEPLYKTRGDVLNYFPGDSYRKGQKESILEIEDAFFVQNKRFVIAELPTGVGKSYIAVTLARLFGRSHILTPQKQLQTQYSESFPEIYSMKGRNAYTCNLLHQQIICEIADQLYGDDVSPDPSKWTQEVKDAVNSFYERQKANGFLKREDCDVGPCKKIKKLKCEDCAYKLALQAAAAAPITVHNFDSFYFQSVFARAFSARQLMVIDEAHQTESKYLNFMSFELSNKNRPELQFKKFATAIEYLPLLTEQRLILVEEGKKLKKLSDERDLSDQEAERLDELRSLVRRMGSCISSLENGKEYVVDYITKTGYEVLLFRPVFVGTFAYSHLSEFADRILFLSATIHDKDQFCRDVGIDPEDTAFVCVDSSFPAKNRPVVFMPIGSLSFKDKEKTAPFIVPAIERILSRFPSPTKGIIHTHSEFWATFLKNGCTNPRLTFRRDYRTVEEALAIHDQKPGSFLVGSGLKEGLDLFEDRSRVQIILKVPYPDLGDKRTARKKELDPKWYNSATRTSFIQTCGRSVRSEKDKAITYLLDSGFELFYKYNKRYLPKYVLEAMHMEPVSWKSGTIK